MRNQLSMENREPRGETSSLREPRQETDSKFLRGLRENLKREPKDLKRDKMSISLLSLDS